MEAFGGKYLTAMQWDGPAHEMILDSMQAGFDEPEIAAVGRAIFSMVERLA